MRVVTYNILNGAAGRERAVEVVLRATGADVVVLQEVVSRATVEDLARSLQMHHFIAPSATRWQVAILSRGALVSAAVHGVRRLRNVVDVVVRATRTSTTQVRVIGLHAAPFPNVLSECWRAWELRLALRCAAGDVGSYSLIAGDLNALAPGDTVRMEGWPWYLKAMALAQGNHLHRFAIRQMSKAGFIDCFRTCTPDEAGYTVPTPHPNARIDYIFANPALATRLTSCVRVDEPREAHVASDHYPVLAEFAV
jgi:exonuclease III